MWRRRLLAFGLTIGGLVGAVAILPPLVLGPQFVRWLTPDSVEAATLQTIDALFWPALGLAVLAGLATLYHLGVPWKTPWLRDLPGAVLALALLLLASAGLRTYIDASLQDITIFRRLAFPIAAVIWLYVTAFAVLLGAEFNSEIEKMWPHENYTWRLRRKCRTVTDDDSP
jgi:membrane protein